MMAAPLLASNDVRRMDADTKRILMNAEVIAIDQDSLGSQAHKLVDRDDWNIFLRPLANGDYAVAILNRAGQPRSYRLEWTALGLCGKFDIRDTWEHKDLGVATFWKGTVDVHETKLFRLRPRK
jgi:alpha-galactosidase